MKKFLLTAAAILLCLGLFPAVQVNAADEWIELPSLKDIAPEKAFRVEFNRGLTEKEIDGIVLVQSGKFIPATIEVQGKAATVTPVHSLQKNTIYDMRIFIAGKKYRLRIETTGSSQNDGLLYKGKTDVRSFFADGKIVQNVHHYVVDMGTGHSINLYVTDDYEKQYGKGFAYDETKSAIQSIEAVRKVKPYATKDGSLDIFFYTRESNTPLPDNYQAAINSWRSNTGDGAPSEIIVNGSRMQYDFRTSYVHELVHYFDYQSKINELESMRTYETFWGPDYRFWLLEGGAEYGGYFFYNYPLNDKNNLRTMLLKPTKESILTYAKEQGGGKKNLLYDVELDSFDDIYKASNNNYGVTLALFWYLSETYGYDAIYDYAIDVADTFNGRQTISQKEKEDLAKKHFGKTEEAVLKDWLAAFNTFDGKLQEYKETTVGTANAIFLKNDPRFPIPGSLGDRSDGGYSFAVNVEEWIPEVGDGQASSFIVKSTQLFELRAPGKDTVQVTRSGGFYTGRLTNGDHLYAFNFVIPAEELRKMEKGTKYTLHPVNNDTTYRWVVPESVLLEW